MKLYHLRQTAINVSSVTFCRRTILVLTQVAISLHSY